MIALAATPEMLILTPQHDHAEIAEGTSQTISAESVKVIPTYKLALRMICSFLPPQPTFRPEYSYDHNRLAPKKNPSIKNSG